ncbi:MAG: hypothetical protein QNJ73_17715 [Gammaproteobacteria bacterium]|nr:hypothetical protein [Gammaproteobacteria bacterium]
MYRRVLDAISVNACLLVLVLPAASHAEPPRYSFIGVSYEWTDVKYGVGTQNALLNSGRFEGVNVDASLGIVGFAHVGGQYFDGDCTNCVDPQRVNPGNPPSSADLDFSGYKVGIGFNPTLSFIGDDETDLVLRINYVDVELKGPGADVATDGYSIEGMVRAQVSPRAEVWAGYEYFDLDDTSGDVVLGFGYELAAGFAFLARGIVFNNEAGFDLGLRWYFGSALFGDRDSVVRR